MAKVITILSFSSRKDGNCARISEYLTQFYSRTNVQSFIIGSDSFAPCGGCDYDCLKPGLKCPQLNAEQSAIMNRICDSNLVFFIIPNYCGYPCANYFAFNERSVGYFGMDRGKMNAYMNVPKRFIVVSNTEGFEDAMRQQTNSEPEILYLKSGKYKKRSIAGDILESEDAKTDLKQFLAMTDECVNLSV